MNSIFNINNGLFTFLSKICDCFLLSIVWIILCIPIITIGPATTAMYYTAVKVIRRERGYLMREFFKSFRMNFKRAAIIGISLTIILILLILDLRISNAFIKGSARFGYVMFGIYMAIIFFVLSFTIYVFPVLSRFEMNMKQLIRAALLMPIKHILHTIGMLIITVVAVIAFLSMPFLIVILPTTYTLIISLIMERVLKKYMPKSKDNHSKDEWYLE